MLNRYCMLNHGIWWHPTVIVKLMASCWPFHSTLDHPLSWMLSDLSDLSAKPSWEMTSSASWLLFTGDMWFDPTIGHNMWMDMDGHNMIKPKWPNLYVCKVYVYMNYYIYSCNQSSVIWVEHAHMYTYIYVYIVWPLHIYIYITYSNDKNNKWYIYVYIYIYLSTIDSHHHSPPLLRWKNSPRPSRRRRQPLVFGFQVDHDGSKLVDWEYVYIYMDWWI
jgi:hypothetical protein